MTLYLMLERKFFHDGPNCNYGLLIQRAAALDGPCVHKGLTPPVLFGAVEYLHPPTRSVSVGFCGLSHSNTGESITSLISLYDGALWCVTCPAQYLQYSKKD